MTSGSWSLDPEAVGAALTRLRSAKCVLFPTHQNVDADGLASPLAIARALDRFGVTSVILVSDGNLPDSLTFLPDVDRVKIYGVDEMPAYDLICMVDCSDRRRLGSFYRDDPDRVSGSTPIVNIDHHVTNDLYGVVNIVVPTAAATAEIVADILQMWNVEIDEAIAQCLLAGIYGDTLGLRTEGTTSRTIRTSADLVDAGANPAQITDALFRLKPKSTVCLWEHALRVVGWHGQLIWTEVSRETLSGCGADASEAEGLVNFLAGTEGSRVAALLYEVDGGWRVSLRSLETTVDVAHIAAEFGGGGHPRAAGCTVTDGEAGKLAFLARVAERVAAL